MTRRVRWRRGRSASLGAASLIDVLLVIVLFLIAQPQKATGECCIERRMSVPYASRGEDLIDAPVVTVGPGGILVDGVGAGSPREIAEGGRVVRVDEVRQVLASKRALWRQVLPNKPFPGVCMLAIDREVPAVVVKSVFRSAVEAGYHQVSFIVHDLPE